jgi:hypothetical protein
MFNRRNVIDIVRKSLSSSPGSHETASRDWKHVVEPEITAGKTLELAWRVEAKLDWVWKEDDVMGQPRPWAVLCGLAMQQVNDGRLLTRCSADLVLRELNRRI